LRSSASWISSGLWADEHALLADALEQALEHVEPVLAMEPLGQGAVRGDADGLAAGGVVDAVGMLVPVGLAQAQPVHAAAALAVEVEIGQRPVGVAVLPGVDADFLAAAEQSDDALRRVPVGVVAAEDAVEVRVAVDRIAADDEAGDLMLAEADGRQSCGRGGGLGLGGLCLSGAGGSGGGQGGAGLQEVTTIGHGDAS
jgi:hypothetical protein